MSPTAAVLAGLAPAAFFLVALMARREPGLRPRRLLAAARAATLVALGVGLGAAASVALDGPATSPLLGAWGFGLSLRLDALSATMLLLVAFIGAIVVAYSRSYLDGDARQGVFTGRLCLTLAAVMLLVLSGNLVQLVLAWIGTSLALHRLLVFYPERPKAALAARKKFVTARFADACLVLAALIVAGAFGTGDIAAIGAAARASGDAVPAGIGLAALLVAGAALLKSAQFPAHGWLPEVVETPTPVSALLHAGIINAGGFLVVRLADVVVLSAPALHVLAVVGGFTALFGALVMLTQTSVKASLAWSTISQMGFMLLQCGLGLFALAVLHIVAHGLYKAHAFLSSGSVVELKRAAWTPEKGAPARAFVALAFAAALGLTVAAAAVAGALDAPPPQALALAAILVMGLTLLGAQAARGASNPYVLGGIAVAAAGVSAAYFALHAVAGATLGAALPAPPPTGPLAIAVMLLAVASFSLVTFMQIATPAPAGARWRAARVHLANGLYANAVFDRLVGAHRRSATPIS